MGEPGKIRRTMRDSIVEGSFANIMEYAGRAFLLPMGVALGATISQLSVLTSLPYLLTGLGGEVTASFRNLVKNRATVLSAARLSRPPHGSFFQSYPIPPHPLQAGKWPCCFSYWWLR
ncbi:MAG: hypothetical protein WC488_01730 [Candidatus Micrarchaeia archaeon]